MVDQNVIVLSSSDEDDESPCITLLPRASLSHQPRERTLGCFQQETSRRVSFPASTCAALGGAGDVMERVVGGGMQQAEGVQQSQGDASNEPQLLHTDRPDIYSVRNRLSLNRSRVSQPFSTAVPSSLISNHLNQTQAIPNQTIPNQVIPRRLSHNLDLDSSIVICSSDEETTSNKVCASGKKRTMETLMDGRKQKRPCLDRSYSSASTEDEVEGSVLIDLVSALQADRASLTRAPSISLLPVTTNVDVARRSIVIVDVEQRLKGDPNDQNTHLSADVPMEKISLTANVIETPEKLISNAVNVSGNDVVADDAISGSKVLTSHLHSEICESLNPSSQRNQSFTDRNRVEYLCPVTCALDGRCSDVANAQVNDRMDPNSPLVDNVRPSPDLLLQTCSSAKPATDCIMSEGTKQLEHVDRIVESVGIAPGASIYDSDDSTKDCLAAVMAYENSMTLPDRPFSEVGGNRGQENISHHFSVGSDESLIASKVVNISNSRAVINDAMSDSEESTSHWLSQLCTLPQQQCSDALDDQLKSTNLIAVAPSENLPGQCPLRHNSDDQKYLEDAPAKKHRTSSVGVHWPSFDSTSVRQNGNSQNLENVSNFVNNGSSANVLMAVERPPWTCSTPVNHSESSSRSVIPGTCLIPSHPPDVTERPLTPLALVSKPPSKLRNRRVITRSDPSDSDSSDSSSSADSRDAPRSGCRRGEPNICRLQMASRGGRKSYNGARQSAMLKRVARENASTSSDSGAERCALRTKKQRATKSIAELLRLDADRNEIGIKLKSVSDEPKTSELLKHGEGANENAMERGISMEDNVQIETNERKNDGNAGRHRKRQRKANFGTPAIESSLFQYYTEMSSEDCSSSKDESEVNVALCQPIDSALQPCGTTAGKCGEKINSMTCSDIFECYRRQHHIRDCRVMLSRRLPSEWTSIALGRYKRVSSSHLNSSIGSFHLELAESSPSEREGVASGDDLFDACRASSPETNVVAFPECTGATTLRARSVQSKDDDDVSRKSAFSIVVRLPASVTTQNMDIEMDPYDIPSSQLNAPKVARSLGQGIPGQRLLDAEPLVDEESSFVNYSLQDDCILLEDDDSAATVNDDDDDVIFANLTQTQCKSEPMFGSIKVEWDDYFSDDASQRDAAEIDENALNAADELIAAVVSSPSRREDEVEVGVPSVACGRVEGVNSRAIGVIKFEYGDSHATYKSCDHAKTEVGALSTNAAESQTVVSAVKLNRQVLVQNTDLGLDDYGLEDSDDSVEPIFFESDDDDVIPSSQLARRRQDMRCENLQLEDDLLQNQDERLNVANSTNGIVGDVARSNIDEVLDCIKQIDSRNAFENAKFLSMDAQASEHVPSASTAGGSGQHQNSEDNQRSKILMSNGHDAESVLRSTKLAQLQFRQPASVRSNNATTAKQKQTEILAVVSNNKAESAARESVSGRKPSAVLSARKRVSSENASAIETNEVERQKNVASSGLDEPGWLQAKQKQKTPAQRKRKSSQNIAAGSTSPRTFREETEAKISCLQSVPSKCIAKRSRKKKSSVPDVFNLTQSIDNARQQMFKRMTESSALRKSDDKLKSGTENEVGSAFLFNDEACSESNRPHTAASSSAKSLVSGVERQDVSKVDENLQRLSSDIKSVARGHNNTEAQGSVSVVSEDARSANASTLLRVKVPTRAIAVPEGSTNNGTDVERSLLGCDSRSANQKAGRVEQRRAISVEALPQPKKGRGGTLKSPDPPLTKQKNLVADHVGTNTGEPMVRSTGSGTKSTVESVENKAKSSVGPSDVVKDKNVTGGSDVRTGRSDMTLGCKTGTSSDSTSYAACTKRTGDQGDELQKERDGEKINSFAVKDRDGLKNASKGERRNDAVKGCGDAVGTSSSSIIDSYSRQPSNQKSQNSTKKQLELNKKRMSPVSEGLEAEAKRIDCDQRHKSHHRVSDNREHSVNLRKSDANANNMQPSKNVKKIVNGDSKHKTPLHKDDVIKKPVEKLEPINGKLNSMIASGSISKPEAVQAKCAGKSSRWDVGKPSKASSPGHSRDRISNDRKLHALESHVKSLSSSRVVAEHKSNFSGTKVTESHVTKNADVAVKHANVLGASSSLKGSINPSISTTVSSPKSSHSNCISSSVASSLPTASAPTTTSKSSRASSSALSAADGRQNTTQQLMLNSRSQSSVPSTSAVAVWHAEESFRKPGSVTVSKSAVIAPNAQRSASFLRPRSSRGSSLDDPSESLKSGLVTASSDSKTGQSDKKQTCTKEALPESIRRSLASTSSSIQTNKTCSLANDQRQNVVSSVPMPLSAAQKNWNVLQQSGGINIIPSMLPADRESIPKDPRLRSRGDGRGSGVVGVQALGPPRESPSTVTLSSLVDSNLRRSELPQLPTISLPAPAVAVTIKPTSISEMVMPAAHLPAATCQGDPCMTPADLLNLILYWNPHWLTEYHAAREKGGKIEPPPVAKTKRYFPLLETYNSYDDYLKIGYPLLLLETWDAVYKDWAESHQSLPPRSIVIHGGNPEKALNRIILFCQGLSSPSDVHKGQWMREGDLVILNMRSPPTAPGAPAAPGKTAGVPTAQPAEQPGKLPASMPAARPVFGYVMAATKNRSNSRENLHPLIVHALKAKPQSDIVLYEIQLFYRPQPIDSSDFIAVELVSSLVSTVRQVAALVYLHRSPLRTEVLRPHTPHVFFHAAPRSGAYSSMRYNRTQADAISRISHAVIQPPGVPRICLLMGPPGTGKSHTIIGLIEHILSQSRAGYKQKILLCAPSNAGIDELCRRLKARTQLNPRPEMRIKFVRVGNSPHPDIEEYSINQMAKAKLIEKNCAFGSVSTAVKELETKMNGLRQKRKTCQESEIGAVDSELAKLTKRWKAFSNQNEKNVSGALEWKMRLEVLLEVDVVCSTLNHSGMLSLLSSLGPGSQLPRPGPGGQQGVGLQGQLRGVGRFTCVIIDEACQCTETDTLIPLQYGVSKLVLVGDPEQLPPTVISKAASEMNYGQSLFERFYSHFQSAVHSPIIMLCTQYRMHADICLFPNRHVYHGRLVTDPQIAEKRRSFPFNPYTIFDLCFTEETLSGTSPKNTKEARFVMELCKYLSTRLEVCKKSQPSVSSIGIITPYQKQRAEINHFLQQNGLVNIEVGTVDGFQGREKDVIVISCVRANKTGSIGFLDDRRRLNVSLTRAKYALYVVGSMDTLQTSTDWSALLKDAKQRSLVVRVASAGSTQKQIKRGCDPAPASNCRL